MSKTIESVLNEKLSKFTISNIKKYLSNGEGTCQFIRVGTKQNCGRNAEFQYEGKYYCGKMKKNGEYTNHMGTVSKGNKKKMKLTKAQTRKIADENTQKLINTITSSLEIVTRRAWEGGPYVYSSDVFGTPVLVFRGNERVVEGILEGKEIQPLNSSAITLCRTMKIPYVCDEETEEIQDESMSGEEFQDSEEEGDDEEVESSDEDGYEESDNESDVSEDDGGDEAD